MGYRYEREEFMVKASKEGISTDTARRLLRYAATLQRLAEAQCNGDWPYNGDRDRPSKARNAEGEELDWSVRERARWDARYTVCPKCEASGVAKSALKTSSECRTTPSGVRTTGDKLGNLVKVCPDCRTQELVNTLLATLTGIHTCDNPNKATCGSCHRSWCYRCEPTPASLCPWCHGVGESIAPWAGSPYKAHFGGDPRGCVLVISTPGYPWTEDGRGRGLAVPTR